VVEIEFVGEVDDDLLDLLRNLRQRPCLGQSEHRSDVVEVLSELGVGLFVVLGELVVCWRGLGVLGCGERGVRLLATACSWSGVPRVAVTSAAASVCFAADSGEWYYYLIFLHLVYFSDLLSLDTESE
jgi:hypothetical protein